MNARRAAALLLLLGLLGLPFGPAAWASEDSDAAGTAPLSESERDGIAQEVERGPVRVRVEVRPSAPVIGDEIELRLEVVGASGVEILMPDFGEALGRFEIVDFAPRTGLDDAGRSRSVQTYRLQPPRSGPQSIPPLRVEFVDRRPGRAPAPEGEDAFEILTERIPLEVAPILLEDAPLTLRPAKGDLSPRGAGPGFGIGLAVLLGIGLMAAPFLWRAYFAAQARRRRRSAYDEARQELDALLAGGRPDADSMDAFYVKLSDLVRRYVEDRFGLRSPELTTQEFLTEMGGSPDLARSHQGLLRDFLTQADLVKFAGHRPEGAIVDESIASVERLLEETRDQSLAPRTGVDAVEEGRNA